MKDNQAKYPQLRFKCFTDPWEQRQLLELTALFSGLTYSPKDIQKSGTLVLRSSNIQNNEIVDADNVFVNNDVVNSKNIQKNDVIVVVRNGSRQLIGKHALVKQEMKNTVIGAFMTGLRGSNGPFINTLLSTDLFKSEVHKSLGATINQITGKDFKLMKFFSPKTAEQNIIGQLFINIDQLIALHQRKLAKLKELKQGYLQKLFPKNGSKFPQLRFAGFADAWEQREFKTLYKKVSEKNDLTISKNCVISVAQMRWGRIPKDSTEEYMRSYNILRVGDIAFEGNHSKKFAFGRFVENTIGTGLVSHVFDVFRPIESMDLGFWKYYIHDEGVMRNILRKSTQKSTMMTNLVSNDFMRQQIRVPESDEQQQIGVFFKQLDKTIALHQRKLEKLQELKKGYLQKMFC
ncbi:type I restriction-modification system, specificity subunit S [Lacticaseibacillus paracasei]|uniref:restriction endonuclease subunit S n=1 Tax=Lacticaseibacillus paracasei TaxID=1597 RepID=UPI000297C83E|nr:restriction endonuclease subunit S [Lacticaseibacillus paracasei]EKQ17360.1 type I restriction-modification system, specificity subunit S [Lacticaseibacillus paracasei]